MKTEIMYALLGLCITTMIISPLFKGRDWLVALCICTSLGFMMMLLIYPIIAS